MKLERLRSTIQCLVISRSTHNPFAQQQSRWLHASRPRHEIPDPRPFVPDVKTFLTLIGRGLNKYANKFPSWESLWSMTHPELKQLGIEPPRNRRYLLSWMQKYRNGQLGPGGDFKFVLDGRALLKVATPPPSVISDTKWVVNVPIKDYRKTVAEAEAEAQAAAGAGDDAGTAETAALNEGSIGESTTEVKGVEMDLASTAEIYNVQGYRVLGLKTVAGPFVEALPGNAGAIVKVTEGMWEDSLGRKIDGGERRRTEVRFKKRAAERRAAREADLLKRL